jgi:hypothetical protein
MSVKGDWSIHFQAHTLYILYNLSYLKVTENLSAYNFGIVGNAFKMGDFLFDKFILILNFR